MMGEWLTGDKVYRIANVFGEPLDSQIWSDDKRVEIVTIRSKSSTLSYWHCISDQGERLLTDEELLSVTCWRIPLTIDSEHPERGLWGMLNGDKMIEESKSYCIVWNNYNAVEASDSTTAVLKALCQQEVV